LTYEDGIAGAPGETRTPDLQIRSLPLYPTELQARHQPKYYEPQLRATPATVFPPGLFTNVTNPSCVAPAALWELLACPAGHDLVGVYSNEEHLARRNEVGIQKPRASPGRDVQSAAAVQGGAVGGCQG
jgi:hypothetical protein